MIATVTLNPSLDEWIRLPSYRQGQLNRATGFARYPGGKGINVSRVVHELGGSTQAFALAGGEDGAILHHLLRRLEVPHVFVAVEGTTRNNYKVVTEHPRTLTEINTAGPPVAAGRAEALKRRILRVRPRPRCVVLSGSLPPGLPASTYRSWIVALRRRGIPSALDTSGRALRQGIGGRPWLIKPNRQEAEELLRRPLTRLRAQVEAVQHLLRCGPTLVILSLGAEGALLASSPAGVWLARPPAVRVDSAVGSGDSLVGGFLAGWAKGRPLLEAFRLGIASGAATALTPGTELCHREDVRRLLRRVAIRRVA
ncbi:MAG: 1-phosphofructokinase [Gemmataceae bacterium]|nr:1-phosphofructokinase [Gemmataceae bacterium]